MRSTIKLRSNITRRKANKTEKDKFLSKLVFFYGRSVGIRTRGYQEKYSRLTRLERFVILLIFLFLRLPLSATGGGRLRNLLPKGSDLRDLRFRILQIKNTDLLYSRPAFFGRSVGIRTRGLLVPNQARYQASPHPDRTDLLYMMCRQKSSVFLIKIIMFSAL